MKKLSVIVPLLLFLFAAPSLAAQVNGNNPDSVVSALHDGGYKAILGKDSDGLPKITIGSDGDNIIIYLTSCAGKIECQNAEFIMLFHCTKEQTDRCDSASAKWDSGERFAHTIIFKSEKGLSTIALYYYLDIGHGGMSKELFTANLVRFLSQASELRKMF